MEPSYDAGSNSTPLVVLLPPLTDADGAVLGRSVAPLALKSRLAGEAAWRVGTLKVRSARVVLALTNICKRMEGSSQLSLLSLQERVETLSFTNSVLLT